VAIAQCRALLSGSRCVGCCFDDDGAGVGRLDKAVNDRSAQTGARMLALPSSTRTAAGQAQDCESADRKRTAHPAEHFGRLESGIEMIDYKQLDRFG
jgi:hypothetical protein